jgi:site-specific DNA-cytosine methylase
MKILIACEESGKVRDAFRSMGHEAISCDILPTRSHPEWHIQGDVLPLLKKRWDMVIAFPPCTHLAVSGAAWFEEKRKDGRQQAGIDFFMACVDVNAPRVCIENPVGIMSTIYRKPDQIVQPYEFGHPQSKKTCFWVKGLPPLKPTKLVKREKFYTAPSGKRYGQFWKDTFSLPAAERAKIRSETFQGIADAMAAQWGILN